MYVLQRYQGQCISIGDDVFIKVMEIVESDDDSPPQVRIGIEAPDDVEIIRVESDSDADRAEGRSCR